MSETKVASTILGRIDIHMLVFASKLKNVGITAIVYQMEVWNVNSIKETENLSSLLDINAAEHKEMLQIWNLEAKENQLRI